MICALTVRTLHDGTFEDFRTAFMADHPDGVPPEGWVRFNMLRNAENRNEVITFGFFDGNVEQLRASASEQGYGEQLERLSPYISGVGTDGLYEVVEDFSV